LLVSVIIPCYNGERFLSEAIDSALYQTRHEIEVIVVDDGSTSMGPRDLVAGYGNAVRYIRQENKGLSSARNTGIKAANGDVVAFLDDDDVWLPDKIERQIALYDKLRSGGHDVGLISTAFIYTDERLNELSRFSKPFAGYVFEHLIYTDIVGLPSSVIVPREVFVKVGGFNQELIASEDYDLWLRIAARYEIYSLDKYLVKYRQRSASVSKDPVIMVQANQRVTEMLIEREGLDEQNIRALWSARWTNYAQRHRQCGYDLLRLKRDAAGYRRELRRAAEYDASTISAKDRLVQVFPWMYRFYRRFSSGSKSENPYTETK